MFSIVSNLSVLAFSFFSFFCFTVPGDLLVLQAGMLFSLPTIFLGGHKGHFEFLTSSAENRQNVNKKFWHPYFRLKTFKLRVSKKFELFSHR